MLPHADDAIVLCLQLLEEVEGSVAEYFLRTMTAVGEEHRDNRVNHQQVQRTIAEMFLRLRTGGAEGVVRLPIGCDVRRDEFLQLVDGLTLHQATQSGFLLIIETGELRDADVREVLRTESEESPEVKVYRFHREFMGQIEIFVAQFSKVALVECLFLIILGYGFQFQQSCLTHEDGLYLEEVITMVGNGIQRDALCPLLEHVAVDTKAVVSGQCHEVGIFPRATT